MQVHIYKNISETTSTGTRAVVSDFPTTAFLNVDDINQLQNLSFNLDMGDDVLSHLNADAEVRSSSILLRGKYDVLPLASYLLNENWSDDNILSLKELSPNSPKEEARAITQSAIKFTDSLRQIFKERFPVVGQTYGHFKGGEYTVRGYSFDTDDMLLRVEYSSNIYDNTFNWSRLITEWMSNNDYGTARFFRV